MGFFFVVVVHIFFFATCLKKFYQLNALFFFSLASLIRGQVLTTDGTPLVGVNVSFVKHPHYGYTLTRQDGT